MSDMKCRRPRGKELDPFTRSLALRWGTMMSRCYNQNRSKYKDYGARGIKVCEDWHDIRVFAKWCKENGYKPELQLDRIDNNGDYCPENCRFVSPRENSQNKRNSNKITVGRETLCVSEWARRLNISPYTIYSWARQGNRYAKNRIAKSLSSGVINKNYSPVAQFVGYEKICVFPSIKTASEKTGIPRQSISACCRGKYKTAGGFCWIYTQEKGVLND